MSSLEGGEVEVKFVGEWKRIGLGLLVAMVSLLLAGIVLFFLFYGFGLEAVIGEELESSEKIIASCRDPFSLSFIFEEEESFDEKQLAVLRSDQACFDYWLGVVSRKSKAMSKIEELLSQCQIMIKRYESGTPPTQEELVAYSKMIGERFAIKM